MYIYIYIYMCVCVCVCVCVCIYIYMMSVLRHKSVSDKLYVKINFMVKTDQIVISEHGKTEKSVPYFTYPTILCRYWNVGSRYIGCAYGCRISVTGLHCARLSSHPFLSLHLSFFARLHIVVKSAHYHSHVRSYQRFSHWMDLRDNWYWGTSTKVFGEIPNCVQTGQKYRTIYMKT